MITHIEPIIGFTSATISGAVLWLAQAAPAAAEPWLQAGGTVGLISGLAFGCVTLWKSNQALQKEIREELKGQIERLSDVLEKFDPEERK